MGRNALLALLLIVLGAQDLVSQDEGKITREKYLETYGDLAMKEMKRTGIPASITLSQGCLESDNGNSTLSADGNNHFGIKCHDDWQGGRMYHDDDKRRECFRKYRSAYESYVDHSIFLTTKSRYEFLFDLKPDDYKGWAKGLQKAGYATSNKYSDLLIKIIEENELDAYDKMVLSGEYKPGKLIDKVPKTEKKAAQGSTSRTIYKNNRIDYIIAQKGDTPEMLRKELELYPKEIYRYNDLSKGTALDSGMVIYLQPKRLHAEKGIETHEVQEGESMRDISQSYGVKLRNLYMMNNLEMDTEPDPGTILNLRKGIRLERGERTKPLREKGERKWLQREKPQEETEDQGEMEFEFDGS